MNGSVQFHPLDNLIGGNSYSFLEAIVPFVEYPYKKPLVLFIKYRELMSIFHALDDRAFVCSRGFDCHPDNMEDMISNMCNFLPEGFANSIKQMQSMMQMMEFMNMQQGQTFDSGFDDNGYKNSYSKQAETDKDSKSLYDSVVSILNENEPNNKEYQRGAENEYK